MGKDFEKGFNFLHDPGGHAEDAGVNLADPLGLFDSGGGGDGNINMRYFDVGEEVKPFQTLQDELLQQQLGQTRAAAPQQAQVMEAMGKAALGQGPSLAETQLKAAQDRTLAQQLAATQAARGGSAAANQRALMKAQSDAGRNLAQSAAQERLAERQRFMQASQMQGQQTRKDLGTALDLALTPKRELQQPELARAGAQDTKDRDKSAQQTQMLGSLIAAGAMMFSDEDLKKNKKAAGKDMTNFLDALDAKSFEYKDSKHGEGKNYGIMAQALEKSDVGKTLVKDTPEGKAVDVVKSFGAVLASQAELNKRLKKLEKK